MDHFPRGAVEGGTLFWGTMVFGEEKEGGTGMSLAYSEVSKTLPRRVRNRNPLLSDPTGALVTNPIVQGIYAQLKLLAHWSWRLKMSKPR